jgi:hypothetical protein
MDLEGGRPTGHPGRGQLISPIVGRRIKPRWMRNRRASELAEDFLSDQAADAHTSC